MTDSNLGKLDVGFDIFLNTGRWKDGKCISLGRVLHNLGAIY